MRRDFDSALLIGVLLGFVLACLVIFLPFAGLSDLAYRWQTLIAGFAAIVAAATALWAVRQQILQAEEMEAGRRKRREYAARKMLPHTLSSIREYAQSCIETLRKVGNEENFPEPNGAKTKMPTMPLPVSDASMEPVKLLLEFGDSPIQDRLAELVGHLQIQRSRLALHKDGSVSWRSFYSLFDDALELYTRANMLFDYARPNGTVPTAPSLLDRQRSAEECGLSPSEWEILD